MVMIVVALVLIGRQATKKTSKQEIIDVGEITFDVQPINNFVTECLSIVSKRSLKEFTNIVLLKFLKNFQNNLLLGT